MTRSIKFRAWDTKGKAGMLDLTEEDFELYVMAQGDIVVREKYFSASTTRFVLMQFTGLLDKNRKEIYEGDILSVGFQKGEVYWHEEYAMYIGKDIGASHEWKGGEIIGNIYENPELIK